MRELPIEIPSAQLADFCRRNRVRSLAFFGSVIHNNFNESSDLDVLIKFEPETRIGLIGFAKLENELSEILGRRVDLSTPEFLSPYFREEVVREAVPVYGAA